MTLRRDILDLLEDVPGGLCDACLKNALQMHSHQHVNAICRGLEQEGRLIRVKTAYEECGGCLKVRVINSLQPAPSNVKPTNTQGSKSSGSSFGINELDGLRRDIIQLLNRIDPGSSRDGFSKRVSALRSNQQLPSVIASLMLTHAAYRNEIYYNTHQLCDSESRILKEIDIFLRTYITTFKP